MKQIKIAIADDYAVYREGLAITLEQDDRFVVLFEAENGIELLEKIKTDQPDIVLLDYKMPEMDGLVATQQLRQLYPHIKILIISMYEDEQFVRRLKESGANGYLLKDALPEEIRNSILELMGS